MSSKTNHVYTCDDCGAKEDMGARDGMPSGWSRVVMKPEDGVRIYGHLDLCFRCGKDKAWDSSVEGREKHRHSLLKLFRQLLKT